MSNTFKASVALCVIILIVVAACKKTNNSASTVVTTTPLNQLFAGLRSIPQNLSVTAGRDTIVFGASGTMLHFYANSFKDAGGNIITGGTVNLQLVEMYKPGDFISNRATTMAGGQLLRSAGQINLSATKNGQTVYANKYGVGFKQASQSSQPMALYYGNANNGDSVINWVVADTFRKENIVQAADTNDIYSRPYGRPWVGYVFDSASSLLYTNCDALYYNGSPLTSVNVVLPDNTFTPANTQVYLVLPDINCAMSTVEPVLGEANFNAGTRTITITSEGATNIVPTGMNYKLVVIANKSGTYYYYQTSGTVTSGLTKNSVMQSETQSYILAQFAGL